MSFKRLLRLVVLAAVLGLAPSTGGAQTPSASPTTPPASPVATHTPAPSPTPRVTPGPGGTSPGVLDWQAVGPPWLRGDRYLRFPVSWAGGFAVVEQRFDRQSDAERALAIWRSPDGRSWARSRLPRGITDARTLLPLRGGLVLVVGEDRDYRHYGFALGFWRSPDGIHWHRSGDLSYRVPDRLEQKNCQANEQQAATIDGRIVVYVEICWDPCCGARPLPVGSSGVIGLAARVRGPIEPRGIVAWASRDGDSWERVVLQGMAPPGTDDYGIEIQQVGDELLALRVGNDPAILRSSDGLTWTPFGTVPERLEWDGQLELAPVGDAVLLIAQSYDSEGGFGNEMIIWRVEAGTTTRTHSRRPAVAESVVVDGPDVVVIGRSWGTGPSEDLFDDDEDWAWIIRSTDGGMTWPEGDTWTGAQGSCIGEVATRGTTVLALACLAGHPALPPMVPPRTPGLWLAAMTPSSTPGEVP